MHGENYACYDIMNQKIMTILGCDMCFWNFMHIIIYCILCFLFDAQLDVKKHALVFIVGALWYVLAPYNVTKSHAHKKCPNIVYKDTYIPRLDDLLFNSLGQVLYFGVRYCDDFLVSILTSFDMYAYLK